MDFGSAGHTNLESSEESLKLKLKLPENGFVLPSEGKTYEQTRTYLGTSTSLFTNVKNAANPMKKSPKDSIAFSRSLHQSKGSLLDRSKMRAKTWRETTKCPSKQVIERSHARELAKANGSLCVVMSFRHRQNPTSIRYMLLDKACLPGGEKAFYFYSLCPYCGCSFTQFKAILVHYLGEQGNKMKPSKDRAWIQNVEMWDVEDGDFLQLGNPWRAFKGYKIQLSPTGVNNQGAVPQICPTTTQDTSLDTRKNCPKNNAFLENSTTGINPNKRCVENHRGLEEIKLIAKNKTGYGMVIKLGAKRGSDCENVQMWHFLASIECLPGGTEAATFKSRCPHCENYFREFTAIFRHYLGPECVAKAKPSKRQGWIREVEIWDSEKEVFRRYPNPWKEESYKKKRLLSFSPQQETSDDCAVDCPAVKTYRSDRCSPDDHYKCSVVDSSATALHCAKTLPLTEEYRNYTANHNIFLEESTNVREGD